MFDLQLDLYHYNIPWCKIDLLINRPHGHTQHNVCSNMMYILNGNCPWEFHTEKIKC